MWGKTLKISSNDVYGNVDDRLVDVYAVFIHKKYMNRYVIFTFKNEYNKNKLYFGSVHIKTSSLVTFRINEQEKEIVNNFIEQYKNNNINNEEYELINISNMEKIELISYNEEDFNELDILKTISIEEVINTNNKKKRKKKEKDPSITFLYSLLVILIVILTGITYFYYNPTILDFKMLNCTMNSYDEKIELNYISNTEVKFDIKDELTSIEKINTYKFIDNDTYTDFKNNNKESIYFKQIGTYKYDDDNLELSIIYKDNLIIYKYDEVYNYLKKQGYTCTEGIYNE